MTTSKSQASPLKMNFLVGHGGVLLLTLFICDNCVDIIPPYGSARPFGGLV